MQARPSRPPGRLESTSGLWIGACLLASFRTIIISSWERTLDLRTIEALIFPEAAAEAKRTERFAIPHAFPPALSLPQAAVAALRTLLRIFLGSMLFGVWGAYALLLWTKIPNPFLRIAAMIPMIALFLVLLGGLLIGTTLLLRGRAKVSRQFTQL